jgi:hypothetical protein
MSLENALEASPTGTIETGHGKIEIVTKVASAVVIGIATIRTTVREARMTKIAMGVNPITTVVAATGAMEVDMAIAITIAAVNAREAGVHHLMVITSIADTTL